MTTIVQHRWPRRYADGIVIPFPIAIETTWEWNQYFVALVIRKGTP